MQKGTISLVLIALLAIVALGAGAAKMKITSPVFSEIFALDRQLDLPTGAKRRQIDATMKGHIIAQANCWRVIRASNKTPRRVE